MGVNRIKSSVREVDFNKTIHSAILSNKVTESTPIAINSWAWNDTYKAAHINVDATAKGTAEPGLFPG